jgi:hypothetical protein
MAPSIKCLWDGMEFVSHSGAQLQAEGGMGPGTAEFCERHCMALS